MSSKLSRLVIGMKKSGLCSSSKNMLTEEFLSSTSVKDQWKNIEIAVTHRCWDRD